MSFFNWEYYVSKHNDIKHIKKKEEALDHWINHGKSECRTYTDIPIHFNWKQYLCSNIDLLKKNIVTEDSAWNHYLYYGKYENRYNEFEKIIENTNYKLYNDPQKINKQDIKKKNSKKHDNDKIRTKNQNTVIE